MNNTTTISTTTTLVPPPLLVPPKLSLADERDKEILGVFFLIFLGALAMGGLFVLASCCCNFCKQLCRRDENEHRVDDERPAPARQPPCLVPASRRCISPLTLPSTNQPPPPVEPLDRGPGLVRILNGLAEARLRAQLTASDRRRRRVGPANPLFLNPIPPLNSPSIYIGVPASPAPTTSAGGAAGPSRTRSMRTAAHDIL